MAKERRHRELGWEQRTASEMQTAAAAVLAQREALVGLRCARAEERCSEAARREAQQAKHFEEEIRREANASKLAVSEACMELRAEFDEQLQAAHAALPSSEVESSPAVFFT